MLEDLESYIRAGRIASAVRRNIKDIVREGGSILKLCEDVENIIRGLGGEPAFPCNVGVNYVAAHYTSSINDESIIPPKSIVKVDFGVHVNGCIADTAITINFNPELDFLIKAVEEALEKAIESIKPGVKYSDIGSIVEDTVKRYGCKPIRNLCGHSMNKYQIHAGVSIPNIRSINLGRFKADGVYAIEPFTTVQNADGEVIDGPPGNIYRLLKLKPPKNGLARNLFELIKSKYYTLPFTPRWFIKAFNNKDLNEAFKSLIKSKHVLSYPILIEKSKMPIAQAEHTVIISNGNVIVTTE
ncbi:MAG: type II methionyl aminopeptidase [Candidatus Methanomethylicia archaeon]